MISWTGLGVPMMVLIPNLLWLLFPPTNAPAVEEVDEPVRLMILEWAGQFGVTIIPLFYPVILDDAASSFYLIAMLFLLIVYYAGWFRFFQRGRN